MCSIFQCSINTQQFHLMMAISSHAVNHVFFRWLFIFYPLVPIQASSAVIVYLQCYCSCRVYLSMCQECQFLTDMAHYTMYIIILFCELITNAFYLVLCRLIIQTRHRERSIGSPGAIFLVCESTPERKMSHQGSISQSTQIHRKLR